MGRAATFITGGVSTIGRKGTVVIHADDPSRVLDLQFALDQSYVSRRGPVPTFTRASAAWRINSSGIIVPAAVNEARIDYDPTTLACRGLAVEEQRTNATIRSEEFDNAAWAKVDTSATANQTTSPDGTVNADLIAEAATTAVHYVQSGSPPSITSGTVYTASIFLKKGSGATAPSWFVVGLLGGGFGVVRCAVNLDTGTIGTTTGGASVFSISNFGNGWFRVSVTATATATGALGSVLLLFSNNTNSISTLSYAGQTTSNVFVWGAQFEAGASATSYIPTTSAAVIRSADVCSITGSAFSGFWNASEGTLVFKGIKSAIQTGLTPTYLSVTDGTVNERILLYYTGGNEGMLVTDGGVAQASLSQSNIAALTPFGIAARYKANDFAMSVSGAAPATDVSGSLPTVNEMGIGQRIGTGHMNGWIQSIQYYNRAKTNAQLQALSTP